VSASVRLADPDRADQQNVAVEPDLVDRGQECGEGDSKPPKLERADPPGSIVSGSRAALCMVWTVKLSAKRPKRVQVPGSVQSATRVPIAPQRPEILIRYEVSGLRNDLGAMNM
jgi:hypothetical protein